MAWNIIYVSYHLITMKPTTTMTTTLRLRRQHQDPVLMRISKKLYTDYRKSEENMKMENRRWRWTTTTKRKNEIKWEKNEIKNFKTARVIIYKYRLVITAEKVNLLNILTFLVLILMYMFILFIWNIASQIVSSVVIFQLNSSPF